jgi:hypothetical protein
MFLLEEARELFEPLDTFFGIGNSPSRTHQTQRLRLLLLGKFIEYVSHLVITAALYRLICAEDFFNGGAQGFGSIDHKQIFTIARQALLAQVREQLLHRRRVLGGADFDAEHMLGSGAIHAHGADHVMRSKTLSIDIEHQQVRFVPPPLAQSA